MKKLTLTWLYSALVRVLKTIAQTALGMLTIGAAISDVNWQNIVSVALVAGVYSLLTSVVTGLPEATTDGKLLIDSSDPDKDIYELQVATPLNDLALKKTVTLNVDPGANLSQQSSEITNK